MSSEKYKVVNGTYYHAQTFDTVIRVLEQARETRRRVRVRFGATVGRQAGLDLLEEYDVEGRVGRSTGPQKSPLLVHNARSLGGGALMGHFIVRILDSRTHAVLYSHPKYRLPILKVVRTRPALRGSSASLLWSVLADGKGHARFETRGQAERWVKKMSL